LSDIENERAARLKYLALRLHALGRNRLPTFSTKWNGALTCGLTWKGTPRFPLISSSPMAVTGSSKTIDSVTRDEPP
jgi:hypothetical protein